MRYPILLITIILTAGVYTASVLLTDRTNLDFTDRSTSYVDSPFANRDRAAINMLTNLGVIRGNPDGSFRPERNLNRAEFVKVALLSHPSALALVWGPITCFPDTLHQDWFSPYVCAAKERGVVQGYSDGLFRPAQPVTYAEAIKILTTLYEYPLESVHAAGGSWYSRYVESAQVQQVLLPESISYDSPLTRGQMARLAAAFRAEEEGELEMYRELERGNMRTVENIVNEEGETKEVNDGKGEKEANVAKEPSPPSLLSIPSSPSQSHLLLLGRDVVIADGVFKSPGEDSDVAIVQVVLDREVKSIHELVVTDEDGVELSWPLRLYGFDEYNRTFRWDFDQGTEYVLPANVAKRFFIKARIWERGNRGISEELVEVRDFWVMLRGRHSGESLQLFANDAHFPIHQTVQSLIASVANAGEESYDLREGRQEGIGLFQVEITDPYHVGAKIHHVTFTVDTLGLQLQRPELGRLGRSERIPCSFDGLEDELIFCPNLPDELGSIGEDGVTLSLFGDLTFLPVPKRHLQVSLRDPGAIGRIGAIQWSDQVGRFTWVEGETPLAVGTRWK